MTKKGSSSFNFALMSVVGAIIVVGLFNLYSAVCFWGEGGSLFLFWSQLLWTALGLLILFVVAFIDYRIFYRFSSAFFIFICFLLVVALFTSDAVRGTHGWIRLGPISLQPAEFAKFAYIIIAAKFFSDNPNPDGYTLKNLWKPGFLMILTFGLIVAQGDMGSALFILAIFVSMVLFAGVRKKTLIICIIIAAIGATAVYNFGLKEYQKERIFTFMNPEKDVRGSGYHLMQSKIAVGSGRVFGKGYLKGNINKLRYLPERHTDFIFPVFAEEWGFVGSFVLLLLYGALLMMGIEIGSRSRDRFGAFLAIGVVSLLFWQLAINLGGVLGLMPLTGVTLPLMSYGGSSMVAIMASLGLLLSIDMRRFMF